MTCWLKFSDSAGTMYGFYKGYDGVTCDDEGATMASTIYGDPEWTVLETYAPSGASQCSDGAWEIYPGTGSLSTTACNLASQ